MFVGLLVLIGWLCTGGILPEFGLLGVEAFYDGKRIIGSWTTVPLHDFPLLQEQDPASPQKPLVGDADLMRLLNDGCAAQFNCKHSRLWSQASGTDGVGATAGRVGARIMGARLLMR